MSTVVRSQQLYRTDSDEPLVGRAQAQEGPRRQFSPLQPLRELDRQQKQLNAHRKLDATNRSLFAERTAEVQHHRAAVFEARSLKTSQKLTIDTVLHSRMGRAWQKFLTKAVHPAASWMPPRAYAIGQSRPLIEQGLREGWAKRATFWANDAGAALLDGLIIAKNDANDTANKPHIIVVAGFAMTYEAIIRQAKSFADDFDAVVVLHNSRGVGRSLGVQYTIDQAVEDCKAVLRSLLQDGHKDVGAYGISMGSATVFRAIDEMAAAGELGAGDIGLAASVRGLSSIPNVVGAHLGSCFASACRALLRHANLPDMDVTRALSAPLVAADLMITTADNDWLVKGRGQLARALELPEGRDVELPSGQTATVVAHHGKGHVDPQVRTPEHDQALHRWAERARRRQAIARVRFLEA